MSAACSFCGRDGDHLAHGNADAAICRLCAAVAVDFFGATARMAPADRPASLYPTGTWDRRDVYGPGVEANANIERRH